MHHLVKMGVFCPGVYCPMKTVREIFSNEWHANADGETWVNLTNTLPRDNVPVRMQAYLCLIVMTGDSEPVQLPGNYTFLPF
jgi:hypothetical protein